MRYIYIFLVIIGVIATSNNISAQANGNANNPPIKKSTPKKGVPQKKAKKASGTDSVVDFLREQRALHVRLNKYPKSLTALLLQEDRIRTNIDEYLKVREDSQIDREERFILNETEYFIWSDIQNFGVRVPASTDPSYSKLRQMLSDAKTHIQEITAQLQQDSALIVTLRKKILEDSLLIGGLKTQKANDLVTLLDTQLVINNILTTRNFVASNVSHYIKTNNLILDLARRKIAYKTLVSMSINDSGKNIILRAIIRVAEYDSILLTNDNDVLLGKTSSIEKTSVKQDTLIKVVHKALKLFSKDTLNEALKKIENSLTFERKMGNRIGDTLKDSSSLVKIEAALYPPIDTIAKQTFYIGGATYNNANSVRDNDPAGFAQYYVAVSLPISKPHGIFLDSINQPFNHLVWLRNLYLQATYSPAAYKYESVLDSFSLSNQKYTNQRLINRLDLLQYASLNVTMDINLLTLIATDGGVKIHQKPQDLVHVYFGPVIGFLATNIANAKVTNDSTAVFSSICGLAVSLKTEQIVSKQFTFELRAQPIFWILPFSSSINPSLGPQIRNVRDTILANNASKSFVNTPNRAYFYYSAKISTTVLNKLLNIGNSSSNPSAILFLSANIYSNYATPHFYDNTYFQIQVGAALNFSL